MTSTDRVPVDVKDNQPHIKGKFTHRSWPDLPEEIIRLITSFYLHDIACNNYCPQTWESRKLWCSRMAYTCIRDSLELEKSLMRICPEWRRAIEKHLFWTQALHVIDPNDYLIFHSVIHPKPQDNASSNAVQVPIYLTPYQHLKNILKYSCAICRINHPLSNQGLGNSKRGLRTNFLGFVALCKEHDKNRTTYCGLCLRDSAPAGGRYNATPIDYEIQQELGIVENEDDEAWSNVENTCLKCRGEWLWRRASGSTRDRDAVGGPSFQCQDWEARQSIENFLELAEGNISDVLTLAREKFWLRTHTNYADLGKQLLASQKNERRYEESIGEEEEDSSEEDRDGAFVSGSAQVREISLSHWARQRILDGFWLSPADIWYGHRVLGQPTVVPSIHPCPWARDVDNIDSETGEELQHPLKATTLSEVPPSFQLCEQAYLQHVKAVREVLAPPMKNIVRKLVMESHVPTPTGFPDPAHIACKMSIDEVVGLLRSEEGVWYDGVDWLERKRNEDEEKSRRRADRRKEEDSDSTTSSTSSSGSAKSSSTHGSSAATSPVLSTSTLQTTPSPPPLGDDGIEPTTKALPTSTVDIVEEMPQKVLSSRPRFIPYDPVKSPPRLLGTIPYIPVTTTHLPPYSLDSIRSVWREACAPLYHCSCSVCERAKVAEMNARASAYAASYPAAIVPSQPPQPISYQSTVVRQVPGVDAAEIILKEVSEVDIDGDGEEEVDYEASDLEYDDDDEDEEDEDVSYEASVEYQYSPSPGPEAAAERPRKRASDELEDSLPEEHDQRRSITQLRSPSSFEHGRTSPKRARLLDAVQLSPSPSNEDTTRNVPALSLSPKLLFQPVPAYRLRKRSSEELDGALESVPPSPHKRVKVDQESEVQSPANASERSRDADSAEIVLLPAPAVAGDKSHLLHPTRENHWPLVSEADFDSLITLEDVDKEVGE